MAGHRPLLVIIMAGVVCIIGRPFVSATPGRVGCFYDLQLCEQNELCYNDNLFGTCISQLNDAVNYKDLSGAQLNEAAKVLQYLIETGYKWQDSYTQCVVGKYLQAVVSGERYDPDVCEYLKALLDVIDQNRAAPASADLPAGASMDPSQQATEIQLSESPPVTRGEFLSKLDGKVDVDLLPSEPQPLQMMQQQQQAPVAQPVLPSQINTDDPDALAAFQQYMRSYQQVQEAMQQNAQEQQQQPDQPQADIMMEKKSASDVATTTQATTESTTTSAVPATTENLDAPYRSDVNQTIPADVDDMQRLYALVNSFQTQSDVQQPDQAPIGVIPENSELSAVPMQDFQQYGVFPAGMDMQQMQQIPDNNNNPFSRPDINPFVLRQLLAQQQQMNPVQFNDMNGVQFVPDFSAPPPMSALSPLDQMLLTRQLMSQQYPQQFPVNNGLDFNGMMPQFDPRQQQPISADQLMLLNSLPQIDPRMIRGGPPMLDPRVFDPSMDGSRFPINPSVLGVFPSGPMMDPAQFSGMPVKRGPMPMEMMSPVDQMILNQQMMGNGYPPPPQQFGPGIFGSQPMMIPMQQYNPGPFPGMMMDPSMMGPPPQQNPYGFFPQRGAMPFPQPPQDQWMPPLMLPEGFAVVEPVQISDPNANNSNNDAEMIKQLFAQGAPTINGEQSTGDSGNGAGSSDPTSQSKKDQEYKTLLPSAEQQQQPDVIEDVTMNRVKGSLPDSLLSESGITSVKDDDSKDKSKDDDYIFLMTDPQVDFDEAKYLLNWLTRVMSLPARTFYDLSVNDNLMTFRVNPALQTVNATYIAQTMGDDELQRALQQANGLTIIRTGVGRYSLMADNVGLPEMRFEQTAIVQAEPSVDAAEIAKKYDVVDPTFAFIDVTEPQLTYDTARRILNWLAVKLQVPQTVFTNLHIEKNQLVFRVSPYFNRINASAVVEQLSDSELQSQLRSQFGVGIIRTGLGDRVQVVKADNRQHQTLLYGLIAVACVACLLITIGIIYLVRRNFLMKKKLYGLGGDVESSKEYEELCRQRMAAKNLETISGTIPAGATPSHEQRTTHSSTSSWSEEPAPNDMDITTGHMVLSYMEDHLNHKDRLNEEWASLCTYEADPKRTEAGSQKENLIKNRYPDVLPYDHSRVHLNPDANETKSDYVNASYITDADPKNPAYIATQGPTAETVVDFWQMVWERNATVIVMLTKLQENDQEMCHSYWPKEGSELYSNYEVHLVSEHIWCDDYLVRNFYLKNLQTHETRTVTQFHYLSWPNLGVPSSTKTFLEFRRKINKCYKGGSSPIVVVCSDGVDRTGAYCLIDLVLNRMAKGVKEIDIAATLEHLRDQRMDMVRTKEQFEFVLTAVAQEIQAILKSMPSK